MYLVNLATPHNFTGKHSCVAENKRILQISELKELFPISFHVPNGFDSSDYFFRSSVVFDATLVKIVKQGKKKKKGRESWVLTWIFQLHSIGLCIEGWIAVRFFFAVQIEQFY